MYNFFYSTLLVTLILALVFPVQAQESQAQNKAHFSALADVLDDPKQRNELIKILREISQQDDNSSKSEIDTNADTPKVDANANNETLKNVSEGTKAVVVGAVTLPAKIALETGELVSDISDSLEDGWLALVNTLSGNDQRLQTLDIDLLLKKLFDLSIIIAIAIVAYQGLRLIFHSVKRRLNHWVLATQRYQPILRQFAGIVTAASIDIVFLGITYIAANYIALHILKQTKELSIQTILFLNAFLVIELIKIGIRMLFNPRLRGLQILPSSNKSSRYWYRWLATIVNLVGYGYLVALPLAKLYLSLAVGKILSNLIALIAFVYGVVVVWLNRSPVRSALRETATKSDMIIMRGFLRMISGIWYILAIAYFIMLLVITLLRAESGLPFVMFGTLWTIITIGAGLLLSTLLTQLIGHNIKLSPDTNHKLPGLEQRLNSYIPLFLRLIRLVLFVIVVAVVLASWELFDIQGWLNSDTGFNFLNRWLSIFIIISASFILWLIISSLIEHRLTLESNSGTPSARTQTLLSLFKNALAVMLFAITTMMVLSELGINIGPLIAGAGVLGLAVGFGAQTMVRDVITGVFIQIENAMNTGDTVTVCDITGTVEHISIRSVGLRDISGTYHLIPFSSVTTVSNYNRGFAYHKEEYGIGYREDIDQAIAVMHEAFAELIEGDIKRSILEPITVSGVTKLDSSSVNIRVIIKTLPGMQWAVGRAYNRVLKMHFDRAGIEMPFPHLTMYFGQDKDGQSAPANFRLMPENIDQNEHPIQKDKKPTPTETTPKPTTTIGDTSEIRVMSPSEIKNSRT